MIKSYIDKLNKIKNGVEYMQVKRIDHINIIVEDMDKTVDFYVSNLNFQVKKDTLLDGKWMEGLTGFVKPISRCVFLELPGEGCRIELLQFLESSGDQLEGSQLVNSTGLRHVAFEVEDIISLTKRLKENGIEVLSEVITVPSSILPQGKKLCYFRGPDGVILELAQYG